MAISKNKTLGLCCAVLAWFHAGAAAAGQHTWDVNELFSNADGTVQFIELVEPGGLPNEVNLPGNTVSSNSKNFVVPGAPLTPPTSNKFFLIATPGFAALPGAPTPDAIIPSGSVPFFATGGDTITYGPYDSLAFVGGELPTDGILSMNRNKTTGTNTPTNYAGTSGSVDASPPIPTPAFPGWASLVTVALLLVTGGSVFRRLRA